MTIGIDTEDGVVFIDGPGMVATVSADMARVIAERLLDAAVQAESVSERECDDGCRSAGAGT